MKVEAKETSSSTVTLSVEVPAERVAQKFQQLLREVAQQVRIPGFRPGKVPRRLLEAQLGEGFLNDDVQAALIEEAVPAALAQAALRPLSRPETRVVAFEEGKPFSFELDVEVLPKIDFPDPGTITVEADPEPVPSDADVERVLEELKVQHATLLPKDGGKAELGEVAVVAVGDGEERELLLSEGSELSRQLVGHAAGEDVPVQLDEQEFTLTLKAVKQLDKPELDDLAQALGHDGEAALLESIKSQLQQRLNQEHKQRTRYKVLDALIAQAEVPVPPRLKEEMLQHELALLERSGRVGALDDDDRAAYAEGAEQRLRREVALESLKRQVGSLRLDDDAFEKLVQTEAEAQGVNPVKFKAVLERERSLSRFRAQKEDERALDLLVSRVQLTAPKAKAPAKKKAATKAAPKGAAPKGEKAESAAKPKAPKPKAKPAAKKKPAGKKETP